MNRISICVISCFLAGCAATTPRVTDSNNLPNLKSITQLDKITIGNVPQWLLIRGADTANPAILFLHGGPGLTEMPLAGTLFYRELEKTFTVIHWDQRGAGKSFSKTVLPSSMTIDQHVSDAYEVIRFLQFKLKKKKIFIAGHGWGSIVALKLAKQHPELFYAYIGISQFVNGDNNEKSAYDFVFKAARKEDDDEAVFALQQIGKPPYKEPLNIYTRTRFTLLLGGMLYGEQDWHPISKLINHAPEYTLADKYSRINKGLNFCIENLQTQINTVKLDEEITELAIPVYFIEGKHDYNLPTELAEEYFKNISCPRKEYFLFERSGYMPTFEEPENAVETFNKILNETSELK